ncbi:sucrose-6-phosphate hydrolase, partial [Staphylococcus aureus]|nr:sucrose-6-phosphate hydrolase [Staphylococcus aureus]
MTEWTREERYQRIEDVDTEYFKTLKQQVDQSKFRQQFHIQPETGLLNDPNGLIFYKG